MRFIMCGDWRFFSNAEFGDACFVSVRAKRQTLRLTMAILPAAAFRGGANFAGLVGSSVALEVALVDATLYAVGWGSG